MASRFEHTCRMGEVICSYPTKTETLADGWHRFVQEPKTITRLGACEVCGEPMREEVPIPHEQMRLLC